MFTDRLKQARIAAGLTQDEAVARLSAHGVTLTKAGLSKYERGGSVPPAKTILALGRSLGVDTVFFFSEPVVNVSWLAFRKAARVTKRQQENIKSIAESHIEFFFRVRTMLVNEPIQDVLDPMPVRNMEEAEAAAFMLREHWKLGDQPVESITYAIEDNGGIVIDIDGVDDLFDGMCGWANEKTPILVMSNGVPGDRRRFTMAHELGHLFMDVKHEDPKMVEKLAHRFAGAFLVSASTARRELGKRRRSLTLAELALLKRKYGLSMQAWIYRAVDLGIIDPSHARSLFIEMGAHDWRRNEPGINDWREEPTRLKQIALRALAEGLISENEVRRNLPSLSSDIEEITTYYKNKMDPRIIREFPEAERASALEHAADTVYEDYHAGGNLYGFEALAEQDHHDVSIIE